MGFTATQVLLPSKNICNRPPIAKQLLDHTARPLCWFFILFDADGKNSHHFLRSSFFQWSLEFFQSPKSEVNCSAIRKESCTWFAPPACGAVNSGFPHEFTPSLCVPCGVTSRCDCPFDFPPSWDPILLSRKLWDIKWHGHSRTCHFIYSFFFYLGISLFNKISNESNYSANWFVGNDESKKRVRFPVKGWALRIFSLTIPIRLRSWFFLETCPR